MGKMVQVRISSAGEHFQMAQVLRETEARSPGLVEPLPKGVVSGFKTKNTPGSIAQDRTVSPWNHWKKVAVVVLIAAVLMDVLRLGYLWIFDSAGET